MSDSFAHSMLVAVALVLVALAARLPPAAAEDTILGHKCGMPASGNNASSSDAYRSNLNALAAILVAGARANGSAVGAVGSAAPDAAYGVALCRGDFTGGATTAPGGSATPSPAPSTTPRTPSAAAGSSGT
jgi:hypothetical protein